MMTADDFGLRARVAMAAWVGLAGGSAFGLFEAWAIVARNSAAASRELLGLLGAAGFVVALNGAVATLALAALGLIAAVAPWVRARMISRSAWAGLCLALFAGLLVLLLGLAQFGVVEGAVRGARAGLFAAVAAVTGLVVARVAFHVGRLIHTTWQGGAGRLFRWAVLALWVMAALLPVAFRMVGS